MKKWLLKLGLFGHIYPWYRRIKRPDLQRAHVKRTQFYSQLLAPKTLCFDIGANVGEISESLAAAGMRVVAVEPISEVSIQCRQRCCRYAIGQVSVINKAVAETPGEACLFVKRSSSQSSLRADWQGETVEHVRVQKTTLDHLIEEYGVPGYIKIDVEGCEPEVLGGLSREIGLISYEYHARELHMVRQCSRKLARVGHYLYNYTTVNDSSLALEAWVEEDKMLSILEERKQLGSLGAWGNIYARLASCDEIFVG